MLKAVVFSTMQLVPCCRIQWLLVVCTASLTSGLTQGIMVATFSVMYLSFSVLHFYICI